MPLFSIIIFGWKGKTCFSTTYSFGLKQYSEISGRLKHPFSLTPYSLGKLMFKISVGYDFTLARYAG